MASVEITSVEINGTNFSVEAVIKHTKEAFVKDNKGRFGDTDLSAVYDACAEAAGVKQAPKKTGEVVK